MFKNLRKKVKDQRGLTLVELLAVIVILGIISAIAVPSVSGIIAKTKDDAKVAEAIQIINAAKISHASNATITHWDKDGGTGTVTGAKYGNVGQLVDNIKDVGNDYEVKLENNVYSIKNHDASSVIPPKADSLTYLTEKELLEYSGN